MNSFDSPHVTIAFVDQQREVKYFADKVLHIAEFPIKPVVREDEYARSELTRGEIDAILRSRETIKLPFNLKSIQVTNKEQLDVIVWILLHFSEAASV